MRSVVTGLMMLAGAVVRDKGHGFDDFGWRRQVQEAQQAREAEEADAATSGASAGDGESVAVSGAPMGSFGPSRGALMSVAGTEDAAPGEWDVACEREAGDRLVFDRKSLREMGGATLFRWAPTGGSAPASDDTIYTALADCSGKTIEASWPGKRTETRDGTCGRHLIEAACAVRAAQAPATPAVRKSRGAGGGLRASRGKTGAPHMSATP
jgi:hypothetical protein